MWTRTEATGSGDVPSRSGPCSGARPVAGFLLAYATIRETKGRPAPTTQTPSNALPEQKPCATVRTEGRIYPRRPEVLRGPTSAGGRVARRGYPSHAPESAVLERVPATRALIRCLVCPAGWRHVYMR